MKKIIFYLPSFLILYYSCNGQSDKGKKKETTTAVHNLEKSNPSQLK